MTKKKIEKKVTRKKECNITPSDWIVYLQGEISTLVGFLLPILTAYLLIGTFHYQLIVYKSFGKWQ